MQALRPACWRPRRAMGAVEALEIRRPRGRGLPFRQARGARAAKLWPRPSRMHQAPAALRAHSPKAGRSRGPISSLSLRQLVQPGWPVGFPSSGFLWRVAHEICRQGTVVVGMMATLPGLPSPALMAALTWRRCPQGDDAIANRRLLVERTPAQVAGVRARPSGNRDDRAGRLHLADGFALSEVIAADHDDIDATFA